MLRTSLKERWAGVRNRLIADPAFQRWAGRFAFTRPIVRKRTRDLFDIVAGFVYSQTLDACLRLDLFARLKDGAAPVAELAAEADLEIAAMDRLIRAACSLGLLEAVGEGRVALGVHGAAILGNGGLAQMIAHHRLFYEDLADPVALLKSGGGQGALARFWPYAAYDAPDAVADDAASPYSALMAATQAMIAEAVLDAVPLEGRTRVMDVGGGSGAFACAAAARYPALSVRVADLPAVARAAEARFAEAGISDRADAAGVDFRRDSLPGGADVITLVRILHDHDEATVEGLLKACRDVLPRNGILVIAEPMSAWPTPDPIAEAYFGLYLFAMGRGQARTPHILANMAKKAGFSRIERRATANRHLVGVLIAHP